MRICFHKEETCQSLRPRHPVHRNTHMPSSHAFGRIPYIWTIKKSHSEGERKRRRCKHRLVSGSLGNMNQHQRHRSGLEFIPFQSFIPQLGKFNPKFHFHSGSAFQDGSGLLASQNQRKLNSGYLNHPALESAGREASKTSA